MTFPAIRFTFFTDLRAQENCAEGFLFDSLRLHSQNRVILNVQFCEPVWLVLWICFGSNFSLQILWLWLFPGQMFARWLTFSCCSSSAELFTVGFVCSRFNGIRSFLIWCSARTIHTSAGLSFKATINRNLTPKVSFELVKNQNLHQVPAENRQRKGRHFVCTDSVVLFPSFFCRQFSFCCLTGHSQSFEMLVKTAHNNL